MERIFNNVKITSSFEIPETRENLVSGETIGQHFGKIAKVIDDLENGEFSSKTTIDTELSDTSTNPVQNKVIKQAIDNKADKSLYGDTTINVGRKAETTVGKYSIAEGYNTTASGDSSHAEGSGTIASGFDSHAEGDGTTASGVGSHAEGENTTASGLASHAEGYNTTASKTASHAEGAATTASGSNAHAEGGNTTASGDNSHAEGNSNYKITQLITDFSGNGTTNDDIINAWNTKKFSVARGKSSHVEGQNNLSLGHYSHAEGLCTVATGNQSHTSGYYTKALHDNEAAYGKYNESNDNTLFSIGDGTADDARHNAFEITTTGGKLHDKDIATTDLIPTELPANGGDADTVDGLHSTSFVNYKYQITDTEMLNNANYTGAPYEGCIGEGTSSIIGLAKHWWHIKYFRHVDGNGYGCQIAFPLNNSTSLPQYRISLGTTWDPWKAIANGGNADTLDGMHASDITASFALKSLYSDTTINVGRSADSTVGKYSTAEGIGTAASGFASHAEGDHTTAGGLASHTEGSLTTASGDSSHAEGYNTTATNAYSHAEGYQTTASGKYSHAEGYRTTASNAVSHAGGHYNTAMTTGGSINNTTGTAFVIGNGTSYTALSNAFSVQFDGTVKAKSTITASTTADYAEFFEWLDENPDNEDRVGYFVTLDGNKIRIATNEDDYILGVVSGEPFVLGNGDCDTWNGMFLRDEFRRTIYEPAPKMIEVEIKEEQEEKYIDEETGEEKTRTVEVVVGHEFKEVEGEYQGTRPKLNPEYDNTQVYISRFDRKEWAPVGMLGVLAVRHDGTAKVNGYVTVNADGIATACEKSAENAYRVIKSNTDSVVEIIFR